MTLEVEERGNQPKRRSEKQTLIWPSKYAYKGNSVQEFVLGMLLLETLKDHL